MLTPKLGEAFDNFGCAAAFAAVDDYGDWGLVGFRFSLMKGMRVSVPDMCFACANSALLGVYFQFSFFRWASMRVKFRLISQLVS